MRPLEVVSCFEHVVLVDPPPSAADAARVTAPLSEEIAPPTELQAQAPPSQDTGRGFLHQLWGSAETEFALTVAEANAPSRATVAGAFRRLRGSWAR